MNRNSNVYTVIYAIVLCALVAVLLTVAAVGLAPQQKKNSDNEKKMQILMSISSALQKDVTLDNAGEVWDELKMDEGKFCVTADGQIDRATDPFEITSKSLFTAGTVRPDAKLPVYSTTIGGVTYYVMSMYGAGLWGPIWGYISVKGDGSTIAGASFDHDSETAGLGAKIKDDPSFAQAFVGKHVFQAGQFAPVQVLKAGKKASNGADQIDAITGATKTSDFVSVMVAESLRGYCAFLQKLAGEGSPAGESACAGCCEGESPCSAAQQCADSCATKTCDGDAANVEPVNE